MNKELLLEKGFKETVYKDQVGKPVFFTKEIEDEHVVAQIYHYLYPSEGKYDSKGIKCILEIEKDFSVAQFLFKEKEYIDGYSEFDQLPNDQFEILISSIN